VAAIAIDAHHCRCEMCRRKHFCFCQKYRPQASAEDWYTVLPSAALAVGDIMTYKCSQLKTQGSVHVHKRDPKCTQIRSAMRWRVRECVCVHSWAHSRKRPCPHISAVLAVHTIISPNYSPWQTAGGKGRAADCHIGAQRIKVGQCGSWNLTWAHCQRQTTVTKAYNSASATSWPSCWTPVSFCHFWETGRLISSRVYAPDFERVNYGENCAKNWGPWCVSVITETAL